MWKGSQGTKIFGLRDACQNSSHFTARSCFLNLFTLDILHMILNMSTPLFIYVIMIVIQVALKYI